MNRFKIGVIVFCAFLSGNAASNIFFQDSISIKGAQCKISIADSNSMFSSYQHLCNNYYFFQYNTRYFRYSTPLLINFSFSVKCTLFVRQASPWTSSNNSDTLPISCDSLNHYVFFSQIIPISATPKISVDWGYAIPTKRLASVIGFSGNLLHFVLKSAGDSNDVYLSRTVLHFQHVNPPPSKEINNAKFICKAYTIKGELIQSNRRWPSVYILRENAVAASMVHLNKF
jgi:hypothetical protein